MIPPNHRCNEAVLAMLSLGASAQELAVTGAGDKVGRACPQLSPFSAKSSLKFASRRKSDA